MAFNPAFLALGAANPGLLPLAFVDLSGGGYSARPEPVQPEPPFRPYRDPYEEMMARLRGEAEDDYGG